jgi:hypothetical protein
MSTKVLEKFTIKYKQTNKKLEKCKTNNKTQTNKKKPFSNEI